SDPTGLIAATVPAGTWNIRVLSAQGSLGAPFRLDGVPIAAAVNLPLVLPSKQVMVDVENFGVWATGQNGQIPLAITLRNLNPSNTDVTIEAMVQYSSGATTTVLPPLPLGLPVGLNLTSVAFVQMPTVPAAQRGRLLDFLVRIRSASTSAV